MWGGGRGCGYATGLCTTDQLVQLSQFISQYGPREAHDELLQHRRRMLLAIAVLLSKRVLPRAKHTTHRVVCARDERVIHA